jgi:uncharacterized membrane protein
MKKQALLTLAVVLVSLLPAGYLFLIWKDIPQTVPTHFGPNLKPNRLGDKEELWLVTGVLTLVSLLVYFLLNNLHRIDPKRKGTPPSSTFNKLAIGMVVFLTALNFIIIASANGSLVIQSLLFPLLGLLFAFIGNYMNHIRPNYFAGLRLPWTLSSDENWRRTHRLAGKLWFAGGMLIAVISIFLAPKILVPLFIAVMLIITLVPIIYSYRLFKQNV